MKAYTDKGWSRDFAKLVEDMCCQSLQYKKEIRIEGVLAVTLDHSEVVVINVNRQTKGSNEQCVIPKCSTSPEQTDSVTPMLSRVFSGVSCMSGKPPHVAVTGLGSSNLVGQLVITSSPDGKVPQAKLILNEQNLPVSTCSEKSNTSQKTSNEAISSTTSSESVDGNCNANNSVSSSNNNSSKKSLDSVIAKLHNQTSAVQEKPQLPNKSEKTLEKKRQSLQPTIIRRVGTIKNETLERVSKCHNNAKADIITKKVKDRKEEEEVVHPPVKRQRVDSSHGSDVKEPVKISTNGRGTESAKSTPRSGSNTPVRELSSSGSGGRRDSVETKAGRARNTPTREIPHRQAKVQSKESTPGNVTEKAGEREARKSTKPFDVSTPTEKRISVRTKRPKDMFAPDDSTRTTYMTEKLVKPGTRRMRQRKVVSSKLVTKKTSAQSQAKKIVKRHQNRKQQSLKPLIGSGRDSRKLGSLELNNDDKKVKRSKNMCRKCVNCRRVDDCEKCIFCLDKPKFGGKNTLRQKCIKKQCIRLSRILHRIKQNGK